MTFPRDTAVSVAAVTLLALALASTPTLSLASCSTDLGCSLNGVCTAGVCVCDKPWKGASCGVMGYKTTPAAGRSLFPINKTHNTWNGPIIGPVNGTYHWYAPYYGNYTGIKSLFRVDYTLHGTSDRIEGPYTWREPYPWTSINPAALAFTNKSSGRVVYTLWDGGLKRADSPDGPWTNIQGHNVVGMFDCACGGNAAPVTKDGVFYCTNQHTLEVLTAPKLGAPFVHFSDINITLPNGTTVRYARALPNVEDPFMWVDKRGNFHIVNHRYNTSEFGHCGTSTVSAHTFSTNALDWHVIDPAVEPYSHTVQYDDGTEFTFATLERPNIHFDASGQMTHINLAADLTTPDAGCGHGRSCPECKFYNHCGSTLIALDV